MFNSKLQETIKRATPVGVMGAECRRNVATAHGNHSLSQRAANSSTADAPGWPACWITSCKPLAGARWFPATMGGKGRCNSTSAMLLRILEPRTPVAHSNGIVRLFVDACCIANIFFYCEWMILYRRISYWRVLCCKIFLYREHIIVELSIVEFGKVYI